ncbi:MAG TPA: chemotaxis protein CheB [Burkholderiaceae bacterium]|nr:chemotaxis protein CheB [Burkholderiaceae bacterium]
MTDVIDPQTLEQAAARHIEAIVIGASAGGFGALLRVLAPLPANFPLPCAIVVHLPDQHDSRLAELFGYRIAPRVREARDKETIEPGTVYFAPAGYHLLIEQDRNFALSGEERVNYARPSIDVLMLSAADAYGPNLCGIVLTGANADGADGLAGIRIAGGLAVVQDPRDAEAETMPRAAIQRAKPDLVLSLADIATLLLALGRPTS